MALLKTALTMLLLYPALPAAVSPVAIPSAARVQERIKPPAPDPKSLRGALTAETIRQIAACQCEMTETQASLTQSISTYLSNRDEESYTATQSRIDPFTILTIHAKGMTKKRAESLVADVPHERVLRYGWDKVLLTNDREGWIFDMAPDPEAER